MTRALADERAFAKLRDHTLDEIFELEPENAVELGLHQHDGWKAIVSVQ